MALFRRRSAAGTSRPAPAAGPEPAGSAVEQAVRAAHPEAAVPAGESSTLSVRARPDRPFAGAVHAYRTGDHCLLVTDGLAASGWPELTLRVGPDELAGGPGAVPWPFQVLVFLANSATTSGTGFTGTSRLENGAPFNGDPAAEATCLVFVPDPELRPAGPEGPGFVATVPVTPGELEAAAVDGTAGVAAKLSAGGPPLARLYR
jgi:hypothetical protein